MKRKGACGWMSGDREAPQALRRPLVREEGTQPRPCVQPTDSCRPFVLWQGLGLVRVALLLVFCPFLILEVVFFSFGFRRVSLSPV